MPPIVDEFSKDFASYPITLAINYYFEYNQSPLNRRLCNLTAFMMDISLVRSM